LPDRLCRVVGTDLCVLEMFAGLDGLGVWL